MQNNMLDIMHRGYLAYLTAKENDASCDKLRRLILRADKDGEKCDTALYTCEVMTDWLERIEEALPYIDRAVRENRQFILRQGETVPIEKVRRVSKTSVEHLARHSEMITREPEQGSDIIPEKLLMTENVGTYAVYENRFLYMLLCFVRDFTEIKFTKITALANTFSSETVFDKTLSEKNRKISFSLKYKEMSSESAAAEMDNGVKDCLLRMKNIISTVDALLKTGLMVEVSAAPMLKPPIARTNVLLQNPCFVAAVELYDYLSAYTGDGYTQKDVYRHSGALTEEARADYAEIIALTSYLAYRHGGLQDELDERYIEAEKLRREEERKAADERIKALKEKLPDADPDTLAYILALEDKCRGADEEIRELSAQGELIKEAQEKLEEAENMRAAAKLELDGMKQEMRRRDERERLAAERHRSELDNAEFLLNQKDDELKKAAANHTAEIEEITERFKAEYSSLAEKYHLQSARLRAISIKDGGEETEEDFSSKEAFAELEAEYRVFKDFFEAQWKRAKKQIRKDQLWKRADK